MNNIFTCPKCLHTWEDNDEEPLTCEGDETTTYCPECEEEIKIVFNTDYWFELNNVEFAKQYLKLRGYKGTPKSWFCVSSYLEKFLEGDKTTVTIWSNDDWANAYEIVSKFFDKEVKVLCE